MRPWVFGLASLALLSVTAANAQEGYVEIRGFGDFTYGPDTYLGRQFSISAYAVEADFNAGSNSFDPQFIYFRLDGVFEGLDNNLGPQPFSGGTQFDMPGIISFGLPENVTLFIDNSSRVFAGSNPTYPTTLATSDGEVGWSNLRDISLTLNFTSGAPIPEPATWAMLVSGFGLVGLANRRRRRSPAAAANG